MRRLIIPVFAVFLAGCSQEAPPEEEILEIAEPPPLRVSERMMGSWRIVMSAKEKRRQEILLVAIQDPPAPFEAVGALQMTPEEEHQFNLTRSAMAQMPDPQMAAEMRTMITRLHEGVLTFTEEEMVMDIGGVKDVARYVRVNETQEGATLKVQREGEPEEILDVSFPDNLSLKLTDLNDPENPMSFRKMMR